MKHLIFDFDGTIVNNLPLVLNLLKTELEKQKIDLSKYPVEELRQIGVKNFMLHVKISKIQLLLIYKNIKKNIREHLEENSPVYGLREVLSTISQTHKLYIFSSNKKEVIQSYLTKYKMAKLFEDVFEDDSYFGKHVGIEKIIKNLKLNQSDVYYFGDESRDIEAAKKAKVHSVAVTWGFEGETPLSAAHPDFILNQPEELLKF